MGLNQALRDLERAGEIARIRKNRYVLPPAADLTTGKLHIHQAGYGFLISEKPGEPDIFIAAENTGTAMHGDRVVARISRDAPYGRVKGRREGRVIRILVRAHDTIVGTLQHSRNFYYVVPDDPRLVHDVYVHPARDRRSPAELRRGKQSAAKVGDKVVVRLEPWNRATSIGQRNLKCSGRVRSGNRCVVGHPEISFADGISTRCFGTSGSDFRKDRPTSTQGARRSAQ
jgi:ribonuclease R